MRRTCGHSKEKTRENRGNVPVSSAENQTTLPKNALEMAKETSIGSTITTISTSQKIGISCPSTQKNQCPTLSAVCRKAKQGSLQPPIILKTTSLMGSPLTVLILVLF
ncbi:hypothetical protein [Pagoda yellow mosaic associated virus]|uniref:Uncharacterized protein n=1 Tax=Pagoda yellow mosaic associated virus TaxID=1505530 RepID=A0A060GQB0_9VIRU|nr:hypothetical protein [Pagoda yellow mosaic associated virus]AIB53753.1 hypothetical protein [Pagoda yellow mosaic associated virus]